MSEHLTSASSLSPVVDREPVAYAPFESPIGQLLVAFEGKIVLAVARSAAALEASVRTRLGRDVQSISALPAALGEAITTYFQEGDPDSLSFDLDKLPAFDRAVLQAVEGIPRGEVRTYGWLARQIGEPRGRRMSGWRSIRTRSRS